MSKVTRRLAIMVCLASGLVLASQSAWAQNKHGNTFAEWAASWWTFVLQTPVLLPSGSHPVFDVGNVDCSVGQDGHVWFLLETIGSAPGAQIQRACSIPTGTGLVFPLYNNLYINFASDPPLTPQVCAEFAQSTVAYLGEITVAALLDGKPLKKNAIQYEQSSIFAVETPVPTLTETNLLAYFGFTENEFPDWVAPANCDLGWYGYVEPMSVGHHVLEWKFDSSAVGPLYDMRYDLTVVPRNH
jgi:hypothetical protein